MENIFCSFYRIKGTLDYARPLGNVPTSPTDIVLIPDPDLVPDPVQVPDLLPVPDPGLDLVWIQADVPMIQVDLIQMDGYMLTAVP